MNKDCSPQRPSEVIHGPRNGELQILKKSKVYKGSVAFCTFVLTVSVLASCSDYQGNYAHGDWRQFCDTGANIACSSQCGAAMLLVMIWLVIAFVRALAHSSASSERNDGTGAAGQGDSPPGPPAALPITRATSETRDL